MPSSKPTPAFVTSSEPSSTRPLVQIVVAYAGNRVIGRDNGLPWRLPSDLAHFKRSTVGNPIVMGRNTWESLGRALPGRLNVVISRNPAYRAEGATVCGSVEEALAACAAGAPEKISIIGGEQIFRRTLPLTDRIIATEIHKDIDGDTWFPALEPGEWQEIERLPQAEENGLCFDFVVYDRKTPAA